MGIEAAGVTSGAGSLEELAVGGRGRAVAEHRRKWFALLLVDRNRCEASTYAFHARMGMMGAIPA